MKVFNEPDRVQLTDGVYYIVTEDNQTFLRAEITGDLPPKGSHRLYPGIGFPSETGNFAASLDIRVSNPASTDLDQSWTNWLSVLSLFDKSGGSNPQGYHVSVMVFVLRGTGGYQIETVVFEPDQNNILIKRINKQAFPINEWVNIRVYVDVYNNKVMTFQDGELISIGDYAAKTKTFEFAHAGLYGTISEAIVDNDNLVLGSW